MTNLKLRRREIDFLLHDWLRVERCCEQPRFAMHDRAVFDATLDAAIALADRHFANHAAKADAEEPRIEDGRVRLIPEIADAIRAYVDAGFMGIGAPVEDGGSGLPYTVQQAVGWVFAAANVGTAGYPFLTTAAANLIRAHGSEAQKARFLPPMLAGRWFGTMCLSEPQAGSSLADIRCRAEATGDGDYRIRGTKMWISGGEHELSENIIHLVLARTPDAPPGTKGISLFIVPKRRIDAEGRSGAANGITLVGLNHKMGYRGTTNTLLNFGEGGEDGDCRGWRIGPEHHGLACMFHMMNEARIAVGLNAAVLGHTAYLHALDYALNRPQGRPIGERDATRPQVMIAAHADVRRMLLRQKAICEGALGLCLHGAALVDALALAADAGDTDARRGLQHELDILTPLIKAWSSHYALEANYWAIQTLGGYGYTRDYPVERIYRDNRLNPIHEGTNGIQALDLVGRKLTMDGGAAWVRLSATMRATIRAVDAEADLPPALAEAASALGNALYRVEVVLFKLQQAMAAGRAEAVLAEAWTVLDALGHVVIGWVWLSQWQAVERIAEPAAADRAYLDGKRQAARYWLLSELPAIEPMLQRLHRLDDHLLRCDPLTL